MNVKCFGNYDFFVGVPDSQLSELCNSLMAEYGISRQHIIAANEGNCAALAAGYYLATGKIPVVYLQNSGIGNIINPAASLLHNKVYGIPMIFVVGWRGEPGVKDEPQHIFQGEITVKLLEDSDIHCHTITPETSDADLQGILSGAEALFRKGQSLALIIAKDSFEPTAKIKYANAYQMPREEILRHITAVSGEDVIVSTTGKCSRELFEIREQNRQPHHYDFLTVGSMGHCSSIAYGIALQKPHSRIWCVDGDGAALMHLGAMAVIGSRAPDNLIHIVINNEAHETVGGMPTVAKKIDMVKIAQGCGYPFAVCVTDYTGLDEALAAATAHRQLAFIEVKAAIGSRSNLGRPTLSPQANKAAFMNYLQTLA